MSNEMVVIREFLNIMKNLDSDHLDIIRREIAVMKLIELKRLISEALDTIIEIEERYKINREIQEKNGGC